MKERQSVNVVYLNDDVDYQTVCGSTAMASTLARASVPGLRWMVRGGGQIQRGIWMAIWILLLLLTIVLCVVYVILQTRDNYVLEKKNLHLSTSIPRLIICPEYSPSSESKQKVERTLPVMKYMWEIWEKVRNSEPIRNDSSLPWSNDTRSIQQFFTRVMFEGGRLAASSCEDFLQNCDNIISDKIYTNFGICLRLETSKFL